MGVLKEQEDLRNLLHSGIEALKENGELDTLPVANYAFPEDRFLVFRPYCDDCLKILKG